MKKSRDLVSESAGMLQELNRELNARFAELPEDVQALLVQKGALIQCVTRELGMLLDQASGLADRYENLLDHCERWREDFFLPLREQCEGVKLEDPVDTNDLDELVAEMDQVLKAAGRNSPRV